MHKRTVLKGVLKFTLNQLQHLSMQSPSSGRELYELAKVTMLKQSIKKKIGVVNLVMWLHIQPHHQINHTNVF
jgi:hypothetical protein